MTTWVVLRGLAREAGHWGGFTDRLGSALGPADSLCALDLPGAGLSRSVRSPWSVPAMTLACRQLLLQRGARPPYVLFAMSLGAMVAVQWARDAPGEVEGCILVNTSLRGINPFWERLQPANWWPLCRLLLPGLTALERERAVLAMTSSRPHEHPDVAHEWSDIARMRPVARETVLRQLVAAARFRAVQPPLAPTLLLASAADRLVSPRCSQRIARAWGMPLRLHPTAGHDLPLDDPDWVVEQVARWRREAGRP